MSYDLCPELTVLLVIRLSFMFKYSDRCSPATFRLDPVKEVPAGIRARGLRFICGSQDSSVDPVGVFLINNYTKLTLKQVHNMCREFVFSGALIKTLSALYLNKGWYISPTSRDFRII